MLLFTESAIPSFARGEDIERWMAHEGLSRAPDSIKVMAKISVENHAVLNEVARKFPDAFPKKEAVAA